MKKLFAAAILGISALAMTTPASAQVDRHEQNQEHRIHQGVRSGELTPREAAHLQRQQRNIRRAEYRMRSRHHGHLTWAERHRLERRQARASHNIYRKKHNHRSY